MNINVATWGRLLKKNIPLAANKSDLGGDQRQDQESFAGKSHFISSRCIFRFVRKVRCFSRINSYWRDASDLGSLYLHHMTVGSPSNQKLMIDFLSFVIRNSSGVENVVL